MLRRGGTDAGERWNRCCGEVEQVLGIARIFRPWRKYWCAQHVPASTHQIVFVFTSLTVIVEFEALANLLLCTARAGMAISGCAGVHSIPCYDRVGVCYRSAGVHGTCPHGHLRLCWRAQHFLLSSIWCVLQKCWRAQYLPAWPSQVVLACTALIVIMNLCVLQKCWRAQYLPA